MAENFLQDHWRPALPNESWQHILANGQCLVANLALTTVPGILRLLERTKEFTMAALHFAIMRAIILQSTFKATPQTASGLMENKQKHLEFLQAVINRMAGNSFLLKGWAITLVAALFALSSKDTNHDYIVVAYFPVVMFWILDGYFLSQERLFRDLYNRVRRLDEKEIDFVMDTTAFRGNERNSWGRSMLSVTLLLFYVSLVVVMLLVIFLIR